MNTIHARGCSCFDCKNNYTPVQDRATYKYRKFHKSTGKRPNRNKIQKTIRGSFSTQEKKEYGEMMSFFKNI